MDSETVLKKDQVQSPPESITSTMEVKDMMTSPVKVPAITYRSPVKSHSTAEIKASIGQDSSKKIKAFQNQVIDVPAHNEGYSVTDKKAGKKTGHLPKSSPPSSLKRPKSWGTADMREKSGIGMAKEAPDLGNFTLEVQKIISKAVQDPNKLSSHEMTTLLEKIMKRTVASVYYTCPASKLCITIIEKERKETFLESLLDLCEEWYEERDKILKSNSSSGASPTPRFCAFMQFLNEMYCKLKQRQLQLDTHYDGVPPGTVLLKLAYKCCLDCLEPPISQGEIDSLFSVLTSVGRDLQNELPREFKILLGSIRDAFITAAVNPTIKKTLLQLIELQASKWQLPASAVMYYTSY